MDKSKKRKFIISSIVLLVGIVFSVYISTILHRMLSLKQLTNITLPSLKESIKSIIVSTQHLKLFLCLIGLSALASIGLCFSSNEGYKSDLQMITPKIYTPVKAGQNQHGSARWLTDKEKETAFKSYFIDPTDNHIRELIKLGYEDLKGSERNE